MGVRIQGADQEPGVGGQVLGAGYEPEDVEAALRRHLAIETREIWRGESKSIKKRGPRWEAPLTLLSIFRTQ